MTRIEEAITVIPRRFFVGEEYQAHKDIRIPIGRGVNSTKPSQVARCLELLEPQGRVLEIGTGCGWQTALLTELCDEVYSIEYSQRLYERAVHNLQGYPVVLKQGDGYEGWEEHAPFDRMVCCAAVPEINPRLLSQLAVGGILVAPVGDKAQQMLTKITNTPNGLKTKTLEECGFVVAG
jgi:protein-L-isoaspartate(D-aspartate) O-methyltransferase